MSLVSISWLTTSLSDGVLMVISGALVEAYMLSKDGSRVYFLTYPQTPPKPTLTFGE